MSAQARRRAQAFGWPRVAQQVLSYYERLLHERAIAEGERPAQVS